MGYRKLHIGREVWRWDNEEETEENKQSHNVKKIFSYN